ncbi:MAG: TatD family hydrolase [Clostridiales bacterium]|jgi:TatD DNase family protein|nr:TatD family hydrolase [Clostridiales bacterium]
MYFESHAHYDDERYDEDRAELLEALPQCGIEFCINVGAGMASSTASAALAKEYGFIYAAVGVHPHEAESLTDGDMAVLRGLCSHPRVVAVGEIGLDFYYDYARDPQRLWFRKQLALAGEAGLPVIIHSREADQETYDIVRESGIRRGVVHCFPGSAEMAAQYIRLGFKIGVGGIITFKKARKLAEVVERTALEHILVETDCPYLAPEPRRGQRNDSRCLEFIVNKIAEIKKAAPEEVAEVTLANGRELFGI